MCSTVLDGHDKDGQIYLFNGYIDGATTQHCTVTLQLTHSSCDQHLQLLQQLGL